MSWLFGRKKQQKDSPPDSTEDEQASDQGEGFVHVPKWPPTPSSVGQEAAPYPSGNLYPYVPSVAELPQIPSVDASKDFGQGDTGYYLNGVPFKLCKRLECCASNDVEMEKLRISEILSFIERIENENYEYTFSLEESVVSEMNSRTDE